MKHSRLCVLGLMLLGIVALGVSPAGAASSAGPYYATPAWDQKLDAATRFIVLTNWNDEAVLDRETGLVWEKSPSSFKQVWQHGGDFNANDYCRKKKVGNRLGWRLPTAEELASLVDPTTNNPALPSGHPFSNVQSSYYWSATTDLLIRGDGAWTVEFGSGQMFSYNQLSDNYVWCVRGGQGYDGR